MQLFPAKRFGLLLLMTLMLTLCLSPGSTSAESQSNILRLHVIADSDRPADQAVKLLVRDAVVALMPASASARETRSFLLENGRLLQETVETVLREQGFSYGAQLMLGVSRFPDRVYGQTLFPAGEYEALRIVLGRGAGQNWWCVLFPPLCIVTKEQQPLPQSDEIVLESSVFGWIRAWRERKAQ